MTATLSLAAPLIAKEHSVGGAVAIGALVGIVLIIWLIIKLFGAILRHPFISIILFAIGGFAIFKFALGGIIALGAVAAVGVGALWLKTGDQ
ncbi:hypothetical protein [Schleiferilactobacillus shenzhenensis]|uniref:Uncharacterized protein n=1 Tax=Schleiferilactobacillus shenzhenensis LY-73 TaxID=1231336 RepID=U4TZ82_9LACO|nr:hypothetical protein [Schleiferilactobacillus shenzhenensis]ERL66622.1 hypothetical protein L248_0301 [Schleiferilactobacillus shenzhenensis LY-73]